MMISPLCVFGLSGFLGLDTAFVERMCLILECVWLFQVSMCAKCKCDHVRVNVTDGYVL